jgi:putative ABC transport system substrate-binding protein
VNPVERGLVAGLARPGRNLTGVTLLSHEVWRKRVELISELVPGAGVIAHLVDPNWPSVEREIEAVREAACAKKLQLRILPVLDTLVETAIARLPAAPAPA